MNNVQTMNLSEINERLALFSARYTDAINSLSSRHMALLSEVDVQLTVMQKRVVESDRIARWALAALSELDLDPTIKSDVKSYIATLNQIQTEL